MGLLVDTSAVIAAERAAWEIPDHEEVGIAAITASEILQGVHRADAAHRAERQAFVEALLAEVQTIAFTLPIARVHARLWADLARRGRTPGANDLQIAATAVALGWELASLDVSDFAGIPGLRLRALR